MSIGKDKLLHAGVCFFATVLVAIATFWVGQIGSILCGSLFALGLGLGKEYGDSKASGNKWDWWDILADCVGIGLAVLSVFIGWRD